MGWAQHSTHLRTAHRHKSAHVGIQSAQHTYTGHEHLPSAVLTVPPFWFIFVAFHTFSMSAGAIEAAKLADRLESPLFFSMKLTSDAGVFMLRPLDDDACGTLS